MYSEGVHQRVQDMLDAIGRISGYVSGMNFDAFRRDPKTIDAVVRNLEIIGEASRHIPESLTGYYEDADWSRIATMRNKLIHDYANTNERLVWETVRTRLGPLAEGWNGWRRKSIPNIQANRNRVRDVYYWQRIRALLSLRAESLCTRA